MHSHQPSLLRVFVAGQFLGTGFLVAPDLLLTAFHVVGHRKLDRPYSNVSVQGDGMETRVEGTLRWHSAELDVAAIAVPPGSLHGCICFPLRLEPPPEGSEVLVHGFPGIGDGNPISLKAAVPTSPRKYRFETAENVPALQLSFDQALDYRGLSGGPVVSNGTVVGIFRYQLPRDNRTIGIGFCSLLSDVLADSSYLRATLETLPSHDAMKNRLGKLFPQLGFRVETDVPIGDVVIPIVITPENLISSERTAVGFDPRHIPLIKKWLASGGLRSGLYVALPGHAQAAKAEFAELPEVKTLELGQLLSGIAGVGHYAAHLSEDYDTAFDKQGNRRRVPTIKQHDWNLRDLFSIQDLTCRVGDEGVDAVNLEEHFEEWLYAKGRRNLVLFGDYGTGKTALCLYWTYNQAKRYLADSVNNPLPIYIPLSAFTAHGGPWPEFLVSWLKLHYDLSFESYSRFLSLQENGQVVLFLDGIDEAVGNLDRRKASQWIQMLLAELGSGSKAVITCRTHYFTDELEARDALSERLSLASLLAIGHDDSFEVVYLERFSDAQILRVLRKHRPGDWNIAWLTIRSLYDLEDLARRAVTLDLIARSLPEISGIKGNVDIVRIYNLYIQAWMEHEDLRSKLSPEDKRRLMEHVALEIWCGRISSIISHDTLKGAIRAFVTASSELGSEELERIAVDARTCSFLLRVGNGHYGFSHKSLYEFFVASAIAKEVQRGNPSILAEGNLSSEILTFLVKLLTDSKAIVSLLQSSAIANDRSGKLGGICATIAVGIDSGALSNLEFDDLCLQGADFTGADLSGASFRGCDLRSTLFSQVNLERTCFDGADLEGAQFLDLPAVRAVGFSPSGQLVAAAGEGGVAVVWDVRTGRTRGLLQGHAGVVNSLAWNRDGSILYTGGDDGFVYSWRVGSLQERQVMASELPPVYICAVSSHDEALGLCCEKGQVVALDRSGSLRWSVLVGDSDVLAGAWEPRGRFLAVGGVDRAIRLLDAESGDVMHEWLAHDDYVRSIRWSGDGERIATCGDDGLVRVWSAKDRELVWQALGPSSETDGAGRIPILCLSWDPEERLIAGGLRDDTLVFWNSANGALAGSEKKHVGRIWGIDWSPDGRMVATAGNEGCVRTWHASAEPWTSEEPTVYSSLGVERDVRHTRLNCVGATFLNVKALSRTGFQIARNKDKPWATRDGTLAEWLEARGAAV